MKLIAKVESFEGVGYIAFIDSIKGMVVQANSPKEAIKELIISLKAKIAFDYKVRIDQIEDKEFSTEEECDSYLNDVREGENEINLSLH